LQRLSYRDRTLLDGWRYQKIDTREQRTRVQSKLVEFAAIPNVFCRRDPDSSFEVDSNRRVERLRCFLEPRSLKSGNLREGS